jgi:tRNA-2-methylthio-N6-dimethylallyladenosine synthase
MHGLEPEYVGMPQCVAVQPPRRVYLETFGCQMNELDSELVRGQLKALGYHFVDSSDAADVILYNTCSVRQQAEQKVWSRLGILGKRRQRGGDAAVFVLGVIGCMAEREGTAMMRKFPHIDLMCGPGELDKLPLLIDNALKTGAAEKADRPPLPQRVALQGNTHRRSSTLAAASDNLEMLDLARAFDPEGGASGGRSAYVRITRGCNKFCTYCVVPFTRGAEVHRPPQAIIDECRRLTDAGVIEITLLGQTVNHYAYVHGAAVSAAGIELPQVGAGARKNGSGGTIERTTTFAHLLRRIHDEVPALQRLRFVTSYPRDFGDDILAVMRDSPRICRYLHVPAQSGSNRILRLMNRGYTVEQYLEFIDRARRLLPDVCIAGDIIVGFPTETDDDFAHTMDLLRRVRFKNNFIFKYSPRPGTAAIDRYADDVPDLVKRRRNNAALALQAEISAQVHREYLGRVVDVFVERLSDIERAHTHARAANGVELRWETRRAAPAGAHEAVQVSGRTAGDLIVVFDAPSRTAARPLIGRILPVRITSAAPLLLRGECAAFDVMNANGVHQNQVAAAVV